LAYTELGTTGTVGAHSMTDTSAAPAGVCAYKAYHTQFSHYLIKHINVNPPTVKAVSGQGNEKVAWDFTVQRRYISFSNGPWQVRYTSPMFVASTDSRHIAPFVQENVGVAAPQPGADTEYQYRVLVKLFWYKTSDGSVLGTANGRIDWYTDETPTTLTSDHHYCFAWY
jgi:hypothetical protein